jgi:hypothetical protein
VEVGLGDYCLEVEELDDHLAQCESRVLEVLLVRQVQKQLAQWAQAQLVQPAPMRQVQPALQLREQLVRELLLQEQLAQEWKRDG